LLPAIRQISGKFFISQQDSDPAHRARDTTSLLERDTPAFISPDLWPPNSPGFNPVDYKIWDKNLPYIAQNLPDKGQGSGRFEAPFD